MRQIMALPGLTQQQQLGMLSNAASRIGMAVFDELEERLQSLRSEGGKKHGAKVEAATVKKHDRRWLEHLNALVSKNPALSDHEIAKRIVEKAKKTTATQMRTVYRYVQGRRPTLSCPVGK